MTREELMTKMAESKAKAEAGVIAYNEAFLSGNLEAMSTAEAQTDEAIADFDNASKFIAFIDCAAAEDPMREAVTLLTYTSIATKDSKVEGTAAKTRELVEREKYIDLLQLHKYVQDRKINPDGIGHDKRWQYIIEQLNCQLTARVAVSLGISVKDVNDSYAMSAIAKEINLGKNPTSNTNLLKTLNVVVAAMIGEEFKATSHDVAFLLEGYSKKSRKALTLTTSNHKTLRQTMAEICHRILLKKGYIVEYKTVKQ